MYKGYIYQNEISYKSFLKGSKEEDFQNSFSFVFSKKESVDDIKLENIYFNDHKFYDTTKNLTNDNFDGKDFNITKIDNKINKNKFLQMKKENQISHKSKEKDINFNNTYNENSLSCINKLNKQSDIIKEKKEKSKNFETKDKLYIPSRRKNKIWIRGPYKKKDKVIEKTNKDDKYFPFTPSKGLFHLVNKDSYDKDNNNMKKEGAKNLFKINCDLITPNKKLKKIKKRRKLKSDDIRKKIKTIFHKSLKNNINRNLKKAGSQELLGFLPQSFMSNISKEFNKKYMSLTYEELLSIDFTQNKGNSKDLEINKKPFIKNQILLQYLENNPEISKISGFDILKNMKYRDILQLYFSSEEFENSIIQLKNKKESDEYINDYIRLSQNYINYFSEKN